MLQGIPADSVDNLISFDDGNDEDINLFDGMRILYFSFS